MRPITTAALSATVALAGSAAYFSPWFWRRYRMSGIRREVVKGRMLALTYDDGPSSSLTPVLLDLLRSRGARATFFMLGRHVQQYPQIVDRVVEEGHDIGCHSDQHLNAWKSTPWAAVADINAGYQRLSSWIPSDGMFRPPNGKMTLPTFWSIRRRRAPVWWWTIDSGDTYQSLPSTKRISDAVRDASGGVVLMHDGSITLRAKERNDFVLELTSTLLDLAQQESFKVVPLRDLRQ